MKRLFALIAFIMLAGCAHDGSLVNNGKPVDKTETLKAVCLAIDTGDAAFKAFVAARPGVVDANGLATEAAVVLSVKPLCTPPYSGDMDAAIQAAITAMVQVSTLLQGWQHQ